MAFPEDGSIFSTTPLNWPIPVATSNLIGIWVKNF